MNNTKYSKYETLLKSGFTVFDISDLSMIWEYDTNVKTALLAKYYEEKGKLIRLKNGVYTIADNPEPFEIAQKILSPSYISFHSALKYHGVVFQWYESISSASIHRRTIKAKETTYEYCQLKADIFFNPEGIESTGKYNIASIERAICDTLYLDSKAYFDNISKVDIQKLKRISTIYNKPSLTKALKSWFPEITQ
jgi:predicted transcriptional regulator of viral defense system